MIRTLRIEGVPVLNFRDLQERFSPMALYGQLEAFDHFAEVHCVPLPLQLRDKDGARYNARYLTKDFWQSILRCTEWPEQAASAEECMEAFLRRRADGERWMRPVGGGSAGGAGKTAGEKPAGGTGPAAEKGTVSGAGPEQKASDEAARAAEEKAAAVWREIEQEAEDAGLYDKLRCIHKAAVCGRDCRKAVVLLAVCEIAEADAEKLDISVWRAPGDKAAQAPESGAADKGGAGADLQKKSAHGASDLQKKSVHGTPDEPAIMEFPYEDELALLSGSRIYKYWYHDSDTLQPGAAIRTVKVRAMESSNFYAAVRIELYSEKTGACVQRLTLKNGEFRFCNVSADRVIKFLPTICVSDEICLAREDWTGDEISVRQTEAETWNLRGGNVSGFSAGRKKEGFLLVRDGRVISRYFKAAKDYMTRLKLEMTVAPAVEVMITPDGYEILLNDGSTVTDRPGGPRTGVVSLDAHTRAPLPELTATADYRELALSGSGRSLAVLWEKKNEPDVWLGGCPGKFKLDRAGEGLRILMPG